MLADPEERGEERVLVHRLRRPVEQGVAQAGEVVAGEDGLTAPPVRPAGRRRLVRVELPQDHQWALAVRTAVYRPVPSSSYSPVCTGQRDGRRPGASTVTDRQGSVSPAVWETSRSGRSASMVGQLPPGAATTPCPLTAMSPTQRATGLGDSVLSPTLSRALLVRPVSWTVMSAARKPGDE